MKRFFVLLCIFCALYGLSWANFGESTEGELCPVTFNHRPGVDCDSARVYFGYPSSNLYISIKLFPLPADSSKLKRDSLDLDSIGGHYAELRYYERDAGSVSGYLLAEWMHENPNLTAFEIWTENLSGYITANWAGTFLHTLSDNQDWNQWDNPKIDTIGVGMGDWFADWFKADYWLTSTGFSTFDPSSDSVIAKYCDTTRIVGDAGAAQKNTEAEITSWVKHTLEDTSNIARDATKDDYKDGIGGTGSEQETLIVLDGDITTIEGVSITVRNTSGAVAAIGETDVNGSEVLNLDVATYTFAFQRLGIIYNHDTTLTISADGTDTIWVTSYDPGAPPSANLTRVKGYARDLGYGANERIRITFALHNKNILDTTQTPAVFVDRKPIVTTFADSFNVDLIPSGSMISKESGVVKDSIKYDVKIEVAGRDILEYFNVFIPGPDTTVWLEDLLE